MSDRDGITGTLFWSMPTGDIPPVTVTVSSTVSIVVTTTIPDPAITEAPVEESGLTGPQEISQPSDEPSPDPPEPNTPPALKVPAGAPVTTNSPPTVLSSPPVVIGNPVRASWETSVVQSSGTSTTWSTVLLDATSTATSQPASTGPPALSGPTKEAIIGISSGGAVLCASFIGLVLFIRNRRRKSKNVPAEKRPVISHPIPKPELKKAISQDSRENRPFVSPPTNRFSQDSREALLARSKAGNAGPASYTNNADPRLPENRPDSYTSVISGDDDDYLPHFAQPHHSVIEVAPLFGVTVTPPSPRPQEHARPPSSVYEDRSYPRGTIGDFSGGAGNQFSVYSPYHQDDRSTPYNLPPPPPPAAVPSGSPYLAPGNSTQLRGPRNLTGWHPRPSMASDSNRRSSILSDYRFSRRRAPSVVSHRNTPWEFQVQQGADGQGRDATAPNPLPRSQAGGEGPGRSTGTLGGIDEDPGRVAGDTRAPKPAGGGWGPWEEQRRRIFGGTDG